MLRIHPPYFRFTGEICFPKVQQHSFIRFCIHCYPRMSHKSVHSQLTVCKQSRVAHLLSFIVYPDYTYCPSCSVDESHRGLDKAVYRLVRKYGWIFFDFLFFHFTASHNLKVVKADVPVWLVVRVTTSHDTLWSEPTLFLWPGGLVKI